MPWTPTSVCEPATVSWYGEAFAGRPTASGVPFDPDEMVAAHRTLPFGTVLEVSGPDGSVTVEVVDRGPFIDGRQLDLSRGAFGQVADLDVGVVEVSVCHP